MASADFEIESGIPLPPPARRSVDNSSAKRRKMPFHLMNIGDSFFVPATDQTKAAGNFLTAAKSKGFRVTCRRVPNGIRVWRIA